MQNSQSLTYKYTFWHSKRREHEVFHITQPTLQGTSVPRKTDWEMLFSEFGVYYMDVRAGLWRKLSAEKWMLLNCGVGEDSRESLLDCKEIQPVHPKGDQSWVFIGRTDAKAETPILWPPHAKSWLIGEDSDAGRNWGQEEKGTTDDEMAGWHHWLNGREFEWTPGVGDGQGGLACCNSWGRKESDTPEWLNWTEL